MPKVRKVIKTGNSLAVTLPSKLIKDINLKEGDLAIVKTNRAKVSVTYVFSGHPRQLSLIDKNKNKD
ncbi:hypothetical protein A2574_01610 [Candidatus Shapirobacteria bacterium RIFOXYD1_FULL_38_32]|jgi:antitoxin component of MazEF toxin-antitoxin module|uniref:SpoVT-AbrB domain-containing protein n=1 Tax=Candidatus Shapirobacteria bacterium RIFOXYB1_FULL_38_38 TaxID=1802151 RepID=A0A1F7SUM9_9BACT|nr:MAG: hypothetical protein A2195_02420 [Candidatus Shapirobacteria bacterium RIFOXYA1_FULL_39_17]OGL56298.1 MAG: hypothetical protein A2410_00450 [Candidatus Shapirobacteria bacterium RIFOXYC1_FULL_38_24]OGL57188.1 MAG: hypothetical protein A2574_01610 [Candidatus Shapirobacteria bacterium RIFOXYD1_FULL_38_32]OGL57502.1 MAG: hypothetical protein A2367_02190 [Candidatus Shapirobacteria bacterium RIFOXYB1_FULL_38_38]HAP37818.1 hypothetical protein [Candidatus Shapirobacteria bacterium]